MRYRRPVLVGGGLEFCAFGGRIEIPVGMEHPGSAFGMGAGAERMRPCAGSNPGADRRPSRSARIEGRLDADMQDIQPAGWQPDRFDLHLRTPPNDDSRHRISQRAVENLTELWQSGVRWAVANLAAAFSTNFPRRIDRCRITAARQCRDLDGLARPDGGYYLVKGSGLPGSRRDPGAAASVAWNRPGWGTATGFRPKGTDQMIGTGQAC